MCFFDFLQVVKFGTIKALQLQIPATFVNLFAYYTIGIPLAYGLAFKMDELQFDKEFTQETEGQIGFWYAMTFALFVHFVGYYAIVGCCGARSRWERILESTEIRR